MLLGYLFLQRSALAPAESAFRKVLDADPDNSQARLGLGMTLTQRGLPAQATLEFERILSDPSVGLRARMQWIQSLFLLGRIDEALHETQSLISDHNTVAGLHNLLGFLYQIRSENNKAVQEYLQSVQLDPSSISTYFDLISVYRSQGDWNNALRWATRALVVDGTDSLLYQELAAIYEKLGRVEEAAVARKQAERTYDAEVLYTQAAKSRSAGRVREAEGLLRESTNRNPQLSKAWTDLGELFFREHRLEEARQAFQSALAASPGESRALAGLPAALHAEGKDTEALRDYQDAFTRGLATPDMLAAMAAIYRDQGKTKEAETLLLLAIQQLPDNPELLSYLGYLRQSMGKAHEAMESYSAALRLNPQQVEALIGRAQSLLLEGNTRDALISFDLAKSLDPKNTAVLKGLIEAYEKSTDSKSAEWSCRECLTIDPHDLECREHLAALRMQASDYQEAASQFRFLLHSGPASKSVLDGLAFSLMKIGNYSDAIEFSEKSIKQFGPDVRVYTCLGYLYRCRGDLMAAIFNYRLARDLSPSDPERNLDLGLSLYLARDYPGAATSLQATLRLMPTSGTAHYYLALTYWNQGQYVLALAHARLAQEHGVQEAKSVIRTLSAGISRSTPGNVSSQGSRR